MKAKVKGISQLAVFICGCKLNVDAMEELLQLRNFN
jgi:hypothetical protein